MPGHENLHHSSWPEPFYLYYFTLRKRDCSWDRDAIMSFSQIIITEEETDKHFLIPNNFTTYKIQKLTLHF